MTQLVSFDAKGRMECVPVVPFNEIVRVAFEATQQTGMLLLEAEDPVEQEPYLMIALVGALIRELMVEGGELKLITYDAFGFGCLEIRGGKAISALPASLIEDARQLGVKLQLSKSVVLLSAPSAEMEFARAA